MFSNEYVNIAISECSLMPNVKTKDVLLDDSFLTTLKILLHERVDEFNLVERFNLELASTLTTAEFKIKLAEALAEVEDNTLALFSFGGSAITNNRKFCANIKHVYPGFIPAQSCEKQIAVFNKAFNEKDSDTVYEGLFVFQNKDKNSTIILIDNVNLRKYHFIQSYLRSYLPWLFEEAPLTDDEVKLLVSFGEYSSDIYSSIVDCFVQKVPGYREAFISSNLFSFEDDTLKELRNKNRRELETVNNEISSILRRIGEYTHKKQKFESMQIGLDEKLKTQKDELMKYFLSSTYVNLYKRDGKNILYYITGQLNSYDEGMVKVITDSNSSYLYDVVSGSSNFKTKEQFRSFLKAVFLDKQFDIRFHSFFKLSSGGDFFALKEGEFPANMPVFETSWVNPHLGYYSCLGTNESYMTQALLQCDFVTAIEQSVIATGNLNFGDETVCKKFFQKISEGNKKFIEDREGNLYSVKGCIKKFEKENK